MLFQFRMSCRALAVWSLVAATGVSVSQAANTPIAGFQPLVGFGLTDEFKDENHATFFISETKSSPGGTWLGAGGSPHFDVALLDTGAGVSLITAAANAAFDLFGAEFDGTELQQLGGATGFLFATVEDPLGIYATGLLGQHTGAGPLTLDTSTMKGQTSVSLLTLPPESDLPNILGLPFASQYKTSIRSDQPQIFQLNGKTVRTPNVTFGTLGSGGDGIVRQAPMLLSPSSSFISPPIYVFNIENILDFNSFLPLTENPSNPTNIQGGLYLTASVANRGRALAETPLFFDTGADVTVLSRLNAKRLGFDPILDEPDFTISVLGSGGTLQSVPGFIAESLTVATLGGDFTATNVPIIALDVTDPSQPGNFVPGIIGTNVFSGRNLVIDPNPALGGGGNGPTLYISDPITLAQTWSTAATSGPWHVPGSWNAATSPGVLWTTNVQPVAGQNQEAVVSTDSTVWDMNVAGGAGAAMTVRIDGGAQLTTFSGVNIESGGTVHLAGGVLDAQYVEILGGTLSGNGTIHVGNGPIPGQVEIRSGIIAPGSGVGTTGNGIGTLTIEGLLANGPNGTLAFELGGKVAGSEYDQMLVEGQATLDGTLQVNLANAFRPQPGDTFSLLVATDGLGGTFESLQLPSDFDWAVNYELDRVILSVAGAYRLGDLSRDGAVDALDAALLFSAWGNEPADADLDNDGFVDARDAGILFANWTNDSTRVTAPVPEPLVATPLILLITIVQRRTARYPRIG